MPASMAWSKAAAERLVAAVGAEQAEKVINELVHIPGANASVQHTLFNLRRNLREMKESRAQ